MTSYEDELRELRLSSLEERNKSGEDYGQCTIFNICKGLILGDSQLALFDQHGRTVEATGRQVLA